MKIIDYYCYCNYYDRVWALLYFTKNLWAISSYSSLVSYCQTISQMLLTNRLLKYLNFYFCFWISWDLEEVLSKARHYSPFSDLFFNFSGTCFRFVNPKTLDLVIIYILIDILIRFMIEQLVMLFANAAIKSTVTADWEL